MFVDVIISEKAGKSSSAESYASNEPHVPVSEVSHKCDDNHVIENWSLRILKQESHYHHKQMTKLTFRVLAFCQSSSLFGRYSLKEAKDSHEVIVEYDSSFLSNRSDLLRRPKSLKGQIA